jgi:hypothetical protein
VREPRTLRALASRQSSGGAGGTEEGKEKGKEKMTNEQLYLAVAIPLLGNGLVIAALIMYINAKLDPISKNVDMLVQYMVSHEGKIARLEERTKG